MNPTLKHPSNGNPWFPVIGLGAFGAFTWLGLQSFNLDKELISAPLLGVSLDESTVIDPGFIFEAYMQEAVLEKRSSALYDWYIYMFNHYNPNPDVSDYLIFPDLDRDAYVLGKKGEESHYAQRH